MRKTSVTAYGRIAFDWVRMTAAVLDDGTAAFVRADGSNSIIATLPTAFRTSGDISSVASTLGHKVSMAAVPAVGLPAHDWKPVYDLTGIVLHMGGKVELVAALQAAYAIDQDIAA